MIAGDSVGVGGGETCGVGEGGTGVCAMVKMATNKEQMRRHHRARYRLLDSLIAFTFVAIRR
jgi:hypothetical protein